MEDNTQNKGFTLVELLISMALTVIIVTASIPVYGNLQVSVQLNDGASQIAQTIRTAKQRSQARFNASAHGVEFQTDRFILYQGSSYATRDSAYDREIVLDDPLSITTTIAGDEISFSKGLGIPNATGTITLTHEVSGTRQVSINSFGKVEEE